jgi:hypothetical protein
MGGKEVIYKESKFFFFLLQNISKIEIFSNIRNN